MKKIVVVYILSLTIVWLLSGCSNSLTGATIVSNRDLEAGEITNMYLTITHTNGIFESGQFDVSITFNSGEGVEVIDDSYKVIRTDNITNLVGTVSKTYKIRAKSISARQIVDNVVINLKDNKGLSSVVISPDITVRHGRN